MDYKNDLTVKLPFSDKNIDFDQYTLSLLKNCFAYGLISTEKQKAIIDSLEIEFLEIARQYTKGESSSITKKCGETLYSSVLYRCDVYLLNLESTENAVLALKNFPLELILEKGKNMILKYYNQSKAIYKKAYKNKLNINIPEYIQVMDNSFNEFANNYSARFNAREICTDIDYPLLNCFAYELKSRGVCYIKEYYTALMLENQFCSYFKLGDIKNILYYYGKIYQCHYTSLLINICQIVLNNYLARLLIGENDFKLSFTKENSTDFEALYSFYTPINLTAVVTNKLSGINIFTKNPSLLNYLKSYVPSFCKLMCRSIENRTLSNLIVITPV